jgi:hypothetical protein
MLKGEVVTAHALFEVTSKISYEYGDRLICKIYIYILSVSTLIKDVYLEQWFPTCGTRTPGDTRRTFVVRENNIGDGGKHQKEDLKYEHKTKQSYSFAKRDLCEGCHQTRSPLVI